MLKVALKPFRKTFAKFHTPAFIAYNLEHGDSTSSVPITQHLQRADASGEDLTHAVAAEWMNMQAALWQSGYRHSKFNSELRSLRRGGNVWDWCWVENIKITVCCARAVTRLLFVYMMCFLVARWSVWPLIAPSSPFSSIVAIDAQPRPPYTFPAMARA